MTRPALGTSYSNAGLVSPGDATAWASPAALKTFLQSLYRPDLGHQGQAALRSVFHPLEPALPARSAPTKRCRANTDVKLRLALYSRQCINEIAAETGIDYDQRSEGHPLFLPLRSRAWTPAPAICAISPSTG